MKKAVLLAAAVMIVATGAFASVSRDAALQTQGWMAMDDVNVGLLPAESLKYNKLAIGELGGNAGTANDYMVIWSPVISGLVCKVGAIPGNTATNELGNFGNTVGGTTNVAAFGPVPEAGMYTAGSPLGRIGILYGWDMGGNGLALGVDYFNTVVANNKETPDGGKETATTDKSGCIVINGGISMAVAMLDPLSIGVSLSMPSLESKVKTATETSFAGSGSFIGVNARGRLVDALGKGVVTFVYAGIETGSIAATGKTADVKSGTETLGDTNITVGMANNVKVGDNSLIICGVALNMMSQSIGLKADASGDEVIDKYSLLQLPVTVAFETQAWKGLTVRASSVSNVINSGTYTPDSNVTGDGEDTYNMDDNSFAPVQNFALGVTYELSDNLAVDAVVSEGFLFNGPYFVSGAPGALNTNVSLVARW